MPSCGWWPFSGRSHAFSGAFSPAHRRHPRRRRCPRNTCSHRLKRTKRRGKIRKRSSCRDPITAHYAAQRSRFIMSRAVIKGSKFSRGGAYICSGNWKGIFRGLKFDAPVGGGGGGGGGGGKDKMTESIYPPPPLGTNYNSNLTTGCPF